MRVGKPCKQQVDADGLGRNLDPIFKPRLSQQFFNQRLHTRVLRQNIIDKPRGHLRRRLLGENFCRAAYGGYWAFQLVGQRMDIVFNVVFPFKANTHIFQRLSQLVQFAGLGSGRGVSVVTESA